MRKIFPAIAVLILWGSAATANDGTDHQLVGIDPVIDCNVRPDRGGGELIAWRLQCSKSGDTWVREHEPQGRDGGRDVAGRDTSRDNNDHGHDNGDKCPH